MRYEIRTGRGVSLGTCIAAKPGSPSKFFSACCVFNLKLCMPWDEQRTLRPSSCGTPGGSGGRSSSGCRQLVAVSRVAPLATPITVRTTLDVRVYAAHGTLTPTGPGASSTVADVRAAILVLRTLFALPKAIAEPCALVVDRRHVARIQFIITIVVTSARVKERIGGLGIYAHLKSFKMNVSAFRPISI